MTVLMTKESDPQAFRNDHSYPCTSTPVKGHSYVENSATVEISKDESFASIDANSFGSESSTTIMGDDDIDESWKESDGEKLSSDTESDSSIYAQNNSKYSHIVHDPKYIVFEICLTNLVYYTKCQTCLAPVNSLSKTISGVNITYQVQYLCNHSNFIWSANLFVSRGHSKVYAGNLLACASTLFSGLTYTRIASFCDMFNVAMVSEKTYYNVQSALLIPVIFEAWKREQSLMVDAIKQQGLPVVLSGDGRCDSPGFNAKYCTYTLLDSGSCKIVDFELVQVTQIGTSQAMEKYGFCNTLDRLIASDVPIKAIGTDRHVGIRSVMGKKYTPDYGIDHQYDVYHIVNNIRKKLSELCKKKKHAIVVPWIRSILNHIWFSAKNCDENPDKLVEMYTSIVHHIAGKHNNFDSYNNYIHECLHLPLTAEEQEDKLWIKGSTLQAVKDIILHKNMVRDIRKLNLFCHTGTLECYHSKLLVHCPKRQEFDYPCMLARNQLAALDHNANVGREQAVVKSATKGLNQEGDQRYASCWKKRTSSWVSRPLYDPTSHDHFKSMVERVVEVKDCGIVLENIQKPSAKNISKTPAPDKQELVRRHKSRFEKLDE